MKAAVVASFETPPRYADFPTPIPSSGSEMLVDVVAAGLHHRVRSQADGSHYTSADEMPLVPGIDGVGRGPDGRLRYFVLPDATVGSFAQRTVIDVRRSVELPEGSDVVAIAAGMNPAMSAWNALRRRIPFEAGQHVLVLGATGSAGRMAVQVARFLGAGRIVAVGRGRSRLTSSLGFGASEVIALDEPDAAERLGRAGADVDVVLDYLWGEPAATALSAIVPARTEDGQNITWIQIGSIAGRTAPIPSAALRAVRLQIVGSGQGSVSPRDILEELPALAAAISAGTFRVDARPLPLSQLATAWAAAATSAERIVLLPQA